MLLTRRHFLYGAIGIAAFTAAAAGGYAIDQTFGSGGENITTLSVGEEDVFTTEDCELMESSDEAVQLVAQKELAYGTLVWASDDEWAACLIPTDQAKPLSQVGLLSLSSGSCNIVLNGAVSEEDGFEIYDVRACSGGLVWAEANILDGVWRVYSSTTDGASVGEPLLMEEGDSNWEMPTLAAAAGHAWWQVLPRVDGPFSTENSKLKRAPFGTSDISETYVSEGRMCSPIYAAADGVVITPRAQTSGAYYQLTHINGQGEVTDSVILPSSMRPLEAGYGKTGFSFTFDAIYNYGGGIANLGTYTPASDVTPVGFDPTGAAGAAAYGASSWFRFPRTPTSAPAWCGNWFIVKSTTAVCGIDFERRRYFTIDVRSGSDSYGDYLATTGSRSNIVTFSNIDHVPLEGDPMKCCLVRVWSAL